MFRPYVATPPLNPTVIGGVAAKLDDVATVEKTPVLIFRVPHCVHVEVVGFQNLNL
jgi:hypothetical protein